MDKAHCADCRDDFYNGNNPYGVTECWSLKDATLILRKEVHIDQVPPWNQKPEMRPRCYSRPKYVYVSPERTR